MDLNIMAILKNKFSYGNSLISKNSVDRRAYGTRTRRLTQCCACEYYIYQLSEISPELCTTSREDVREILTLALHSALSMICWFEVEPLAIV